MPSCESVLLRAVATTSQNNTSYSTKGRESVLPPVVFVFRLLLILRRQCRSLPSLVMLAITKTNTGIAGNSCLLCFTQWCHIPSSRTSSETFYLRQYFFEVLQ